MVPTLGPAPGHQFQGAPGRGFCDIRIGKEPFLYFCFGPGTNRAHIPPVQGPILLLLLLLQPGDPPPPDAVWREEVVVTASRREEALREVAAHVTVLDEEELQQSASLSVDDLLRPENKAQLTSVLTYHVVPGEVLSKSLTDGMVVTTVEGETLTVGVGADGVTLTDAAGNRATVAKADIETGNGVVHVIDGVLLPAS